MPKTFKYIRTDLKKMPSKRYPPKINPNNYPKLKVSDISVRPAPGVRTLEFKANVESERTSPKSLPRYTVKIVFYGIEFTKTRKEGFIPIKVGNTLWYYEKPSARLHQVAIKCECDAYRFYWEKWNYDNKANIGQYRRYDARKIDKENGVDTRGVTYYTLAPGYIRKTPAPPEGRPYLNPKELLGYCKHIHNLLLALKEADYIRG